MDLSPSAIGFGGVRFDLVSVIFAPASPIVCRYKVRIPRQQDFLTRARPTRLTRLARLLPDRPVP